MFYLGSLMQLAVAGPQVRQCGVLGVGLEGNWWFSLSLGILWTWVCVVVIASVSSVLITWAVRQIRQRRAIAAPVGSAWPTANPAPAEPVVDTNHLVLQALSQYVAWKDADGIYLGCTQAAAKALGLTRPAEILGKTQRDFLPPDAAEQAQMLARCDRRVVATSQSATCLLSRRTPDGNESFEEILKLPILDPQGKVIGIIETADNKADAVCNPSETVTPNAENQTRAVNQAVCTARFTREYCWMVIEDMVEGFALHEVIRDPDGHPTDYRVVDVNPTFEEYIGLPRDQIVGQRLSDLDKAQFPVISSKLAQVTQDNKPCQFRWRCQSTCRELQFISYSTRQDHVAMLVLDMTEQIQAAAESQELQEQIHHTRKMEAIGQLAGGIAHDFNNLLTAIHGNAELIRIDTSSTPAHLESAEQILKASLRMSDLTQQLLAFGRKGKLQTVPVNMHEAIAETVKLLSHSIDRRVEITQELRAAYPIVLGDPSQLKNALLNLAINARDAMPEGGKLHFSTRMTRVEEEHSKKGRNPIPPGYYLEITARDTGIGMDEATMLRIFEPFFTTKKIGEGTGLGLAGVYGCMKNHKGFVDVESQSGEGSAFKLYLPPAEEQVGVYTSDTEEGPKAKHILVVDDEDMVRNYAVRALRTLGYRASFCADGEEAIRFYRENYRDIDLVLLDLIMPRKGGLETYRELKQINPDVRTLLISGYSDHRVIEQLRNEGVLGFINKPFEIESLANDLAKHLGENTPTFRRP